MIFRFHEIIRETGITRERLIRYVENGWVKPGSLKSGVREDVRADWFEAEFDQEDQARIELICELEELFEVNEEAVPLILYLIDQIHVMRLRARQTGNASDASSKRD